MGKQSTLGKFWELPKGTAPPAKQQADLRTMFAPKPIVKTEETEGSSSKGTTFKEEKDVKRKSTVFNALLIGLCSRASLANEQLSRARNAMLSSPMMRRTTTKPVPPPKNRSQSRKSSRWTLVIASRRWHRTFRILQRSN